MHDIYHVILLLENRVFSIDNRRRMTARTPTMAMLVALVLLASAVPASGTPADRSSSVQTVAGTQIDPDSVLLHVNIDTAGAAVWHVEYRVRLDDANTTAAFESARTDIEANQSRFTQRFAARMRRTIASALQNVTVSTTRKQLPQEYGVVAYTFTWTRFAAVDGATLRVGDAITGLFLDQETSLLVSWPPTYRSVVAPSPDEQRDHAVIWHGPITFADGNPRITLKPAATTSPISSPTPSQRVESNADETNAEADGIGDSRLFTPPQLGVAVIGLIIASAIGWGIVRRNGGKPPAEETSGGPNELLSNEERVLKLLREHDGRIKQKEIADTFDWTAAKTSQVIGKLSDDDEIEVFRLGRENVLTLPETDAFEIDSG